MAPFGRDSTCVDAVRSSPNHGVRLRYDQPDSIILHYTGMVDGPSAIDWLCNPVSQVSCHYVVDETGRILQLVEEARRAWHAGRSGWSGETDMNSASIGIEIVNGGHPAGLPAYPPAQVDAVARLCRDVARRHRIAPRRILAHSDVSPGRKIDPGERFPWNDLHARGVGHWVPEASGGSRRCLSPGQSGPDVAAVQQQLKRYGYDLAPTGDYDERTRVVVEAFQRHFRPSCVDGTADGGTQATLEALVRSAAIIAD